MADTQSTGLCGEHYIAAYLAGLGLAVAVPRGGAARDDLFVADAKRGHPVRVQVKAARDPYGKYKGDEICSWETGCGIVDTHDQSLWYAFVALRNWPQQTNLPEVFFVPSTDVAACMATEKGKSRTFFWMKVGDAEKYRDEEGMALLKAALSESCPSSASFQL